MPDEVPRRIRGFWRFHAARRREDRGRFGSAPISSGRMRLLCRSTDFISQGSAQKRVLWEDDGPCYKAAAAQVALTLHQTRVQILQRTRSSHLLEVSTLRSHLRAAEG